MTTIQIVKLFRARRAGKGKWLAHCPVHGRDRNPSLEIKEGRKLGSTVVGCYAGCAKNDVLGAVGLTLRDLFADSLPDKDAIRLAERMRAEEGRRLRARRRREREQWEREWKWAACRDALGLLLMQQPEDSKLASLFHHACTMCRDCSDNRIGKVETIALTFSGRWYLMLLDTFADRRQADNIEVRVMQYPEWWNDCFPPKGDPATVLEALSGLEPILQGTPYYDAIMAYEPVLFPGPESHPLDGITAHDVGRQVAKYLRLP